MYKNATNTNMVYYPNLVVTILLNIIISHSFLACAHTRFCSNHGIFLKNSTYATNLKQIIASLSSNISINGHFSNITAGEGRDKIYALAQCKGDLPSSNCYDCITSASKAIETRCPNEREAILWGDRDECMLRYANRDIFGRVELEPSYELSNPNNISIDSSIYNATLYGLVGELSEQASLGSTKKFAVGSTRDNQSMYAMVQCTPDLSSNDCKVCLQSALGRVSNCCGGKEGGRFFQPSCFVWFELFKFYDSSDTTHDVSLLPPLGESPTTTSIPSPQPTAQGKKSSSSWRVIVIVIVVAFVTLISIGCAILLYRRLRKEVHDPNRIKYLESLQYDLQEIKDATNNFSDDNKLGQVGFGSVYKGRLSNGKEIAIKRLNRNSTQGEEEFSNEVFLVAKLQHRNLVGLLGFCSEANERILVYELLGNSLDHIIFDPIKRQDLKWEIRYKIICGIARGMLYLHEDSRHKVVHRDLKASNVLVDENMNPKISDFGMARLFQLDQSEANTRRHMGTYGYMAPEYAIHGRFSAKSDVFSFGVLVLEIISSKKTSWWDSSAEVVHLLSYAWKNWREGTTTNLIDSMLDDSMLDEGCRSEIMRCIQIGLLCVQEDMEHRPTMASAVLMLTSHTITLPPPLRPGFYMYNNSTMATRPNISEETESDQSTTSTSRTLYVSTS